MARKAKAGKKQGKPARPAVTKARPKVTAKATSARVAKPKAKPVAAKPARKPSPAVQPKSKPVASAKATPKKPKHGSSAATTSAILAGAPTASAGPDANSIPRKWQRHYRILIDLRDTLLEQSGRLAREAHEEAASHSMHMADAGTDSFDRDFALGLLSADQNALTEIEFAIQRIRTGEYGICEMTGRPIGQDRLEAIPWTRFSYEAQQQLEKSGVGSRVHLGSLRTVHGGDAAEVKEDDDEEEEKKESES